MLSLLWKTQTTQAWVLWLRLFTLLFRNISLTWSPWTRIGHPTTRASSAPFPHSPWHKAVNWGGRRGFGWCSCSTIFLLQPGSLTSSNQSARNSESRCDQACQLGRGICREEASSGKEAVILFHVSPVLTSYFPGFLEKQGQCLKKKYLGGIRKSLEKPRGVS